MSGPALRLERVRVNFGDAPGLEPVSFAVEPGERLVVVGASGAGKTTLLRAIAGLAPIAAGRIEIGGREVTALPPERRGAVYLHQTPTLFPHLSVFENVAFPLRVRRARDGEIRERVRYVLAAVRMEELAGRMPWTLSGGQRHRAALARAIVARPALMLLDEPLSSLDPALREEVREAIITIQDEYRPALVLVTHDLDEAGLLADRIGVLLDRRLAEVATPARLFASPESLATARFLGIPNEVPGRIREDGVFASPLGPVVLNGIRPGPAVAVFRPEAIRPDPNGAILVRVLALRHRAQRTAALVELDGLRLEIAMDPLNPPVPGEPLRVTIDPRHLRFFPEPP